MSKRYEEPADVEAPDGSLQAFWWRGRRYRVQAVLSRWREAGGWWEADPALPAQSAPLPAQGRAGKGFSAQPWARGDSREIWRVDATPEPPSGSGHHVPAGTRDGLGRNVPAGTREGLGDVPAGTRDGLGDVPAGTRAVRRLQSKARHPSGRASRHVPAGTYDLCRDLRKGTWSLFRVWD